MSDQLLNDLSRRSLLKTLPNPGQRLDYVVTLGRSLALGARADAAELKLRYIPDRLILDQAAIAAYMQSIEASGWDSLEELAKTLLEDISNELVPRWLEVSLRQVDNHESSGTIDYAVTMEDRQPGWNNPQLLGRLKPWAHA